MRDPKPAQNNKTCILEVLNRIKQTKNNCKMNGVSKSDKISYTKKIIFISTKKEKKRDIMLEIRYSYRARYKGEGKE